MTRAMTARGGNDRVGGFVVICCPCDSARGRAGARVVAATIRTMPSHDSRADRRRAEITDCQWIAQAHGQSLTSQTRRGSMPRRRRQTARPSADEQVQPWYRICRAAAQDRRGGDVRHARCQTLALSCLRDAAAAHHGVTVVEHGRLAGRRRPRGFVERHGPLTIA